jgi:hypothetical protein
MEKYGEYEQVNGAVANRLQNEKEQMIVMLKVFKACIEGEVFPNEGSPCHKKIAELINA